MKTRTLFAGALGLYAGYRLWRRAQRIDLAGRVAWVTGARGLALAVARELVGHGARVVVTARSRDQVCRAEQDLTALGGVALGVAADVRDREQVEAALAKVMARFGRLDVLVNVAGIIAVTPLAQASIEDFEDAWATHVRGPLHTSLAAWPIMRRQGGGHIVNVASVGGLVAMPHLVPYCASKFALVGLSDGLRAELADDHIAVTTVCPGMMRTGSHVNAWFKGAAEAEAAWFRMANTTPGVGVSAVYAARRIVAAMREGRTHLDLHPSTTFVRALAGVAPGALAAAMQGVHRALPASPASVTPPWQGRDIEPEQVHAATAPDTVTSLNETFE